MCGIAGILAPGPAGPEEEAAVRTMMKRQAHRGPDAEGLFKDGPVVLGHRRLSIVDLRPEASQPMLNEDGRLCLIVNGEIYNFQELRDTLLQKGHKFRSRSDSEVILHLYEEEGLDFVSKLTGMFALALWDSVAQQLILARDRYGKKPLCYHFGPKGLVFASELQALVATGLFPVEPDLEAIDAYLALQYVPAPRTAYKGVKKLEPGCFMVCSPGKGPSPKRYYRLSFEPRRALNIEEAAHELRQRVEKAVKRRLVADVPLGAFLSGGIDSSVVVACMSRLTQGSIRTFSIGFPSNEDSETSYARLVAKHFGTDHHEMVVVPDMVSILPKLVEHYGEPFADTSAVPTWYLSQFTKQFVTVALSGDGGDENFGGYRRYRYAQIGRFLASLPRPLPTIISKTLASLKVPSWQPLQAFGKRLLSGEVERYLGLVCHFPHEERMRIYHLDLKRRFNVDQVAMRFQEEISSSRAKDPTNRLMDLDFRTYLPDDILVKVDIASMAHALEVRCPFLDPEVVEFAASLPPQMKIRSLFSAKYLLKKAFHDLLPAPILKRPKKGFAIPVDRWIREDLHEMVRDLLLSKTFRERGLFDPLEVEGLIESHQRGEPRGLSIWNLLVLETWFRTFIDGKG